MDEEMIMRQREIGKQLLLVNILQHENDLIQKGGYSFVSKGNLVAWTSMTEEELESFVSFCSALDPFKRAAETAKKCSREELFSSEKEAYLFILSACYRLGDLFAGLLDLDRFVDYCEVYSKYNFQSYNEKYKEEYPVDEALATPEIFEEMMRSYIRCSLDDVDEALSEGYDWAVITKMTRDAISEKRYHDLVKEFRK